MSQRREEEEVDNDAKAVWLCGAVRWRGRDSCTELVFRLHFGLTEYEPFEKWPSFSRLLINFLPGEICRRPEAALPPCMDAPSSRSMHSGTVSQPNAELLQFHIQRFPCDFQIRPKVRIN